jgi:hypothetical protein
MLRGLAIGLQMKIIILIWREEEKVKPSLPQLKKYENKLPKQEESGILLKLILMRY